ncbi:hypothetical protein [Streptomyces sp. NPDC059003]|uniref:hypothetical protein n=1 Tax=Streptomyces sp. NPDC059003 TaxID=3346691 RepID=UPI0036BBEFEC
MDQREGVEHLQRRHPEHRGRAVPAATRPPAADAQRGPQPLAPGGKKTAQDLDDLGRHLAIGASTRLVFEELLQHRLDLVAQARDVETGLTHRHRHGGLSRAIQWQTHPHRGHTALLPVGRPSTLDGTSSGSQEHAGGRRRSRSCRREHVEILQSRPGKLGARSSEVATSPERQP